VKESRELLGYMLNFSNIFLISKSLIIIYMCFTLTLNDHASG
jgi:hypothetical protein